MTSFTILDTARQSTSKPDANVPLTIPIYTGWEFKQEPGKPHENDHIASSFLPCKRFPTVNYLDLLDHDLIPDPYIGVNEPIVLWVNDQDWTYRTRIAVPDRLGEFGNAVLHFHGLDTAVEILIDGKSVYFSKNMHVPVKLLVKHHLVVKKEVELMLKFKSPTRFSEEERGKVGWKKGWYDERMMGGHARMYLRKAQYHWGWDWGPALCTSGPYLPVALELFNYRMRPESLHTIASVTDSLSEGTINITGALEGEIPSNEQVVIMIRVTDASYTIVKETGFSLESYSTDFYKNIHIDRPTLWYPHTHGEPYLYTLTISLASPSGSLQIFTRRLGFRHVRLVQNPLTNAVPGTTFLFAINHIPIFCGGANWIPGDFLLPRFSEERLKARIRLMKEGNMNMVRVWGGGLIESDHFYEECDRAGILVWQDMLFACGNYPAHADFVSEVRKEVSAGLRRISHHASLALICGDNESPWLSYTRGWDYDPKEKDEEKWMEGNFQHRRTLEKVLPPIVEEEMRDTGVSYWESSPFGGKECNDPTIGDQHIWDVWHGPQLPYTSYATLAGRFVSEFGFESPPHPRTTKYMLPDPTTRSPYHPAWLTHDKGPGSHRRLPMYLGENFKFNMNDWREFTYSAQLLQAEAMGFAIRHFRRKFKSTDISDGGNDFEGRECSGGLVWQMNDNWPGISWALVDYFLRPKPAYFALKAAMSPVTITAERIVGGKSNPLLRGYDPALNVVKGWVSSSLQTAFEGFVRVEVWHIRTGDRLGECTSANAVRIGANTTTELPDFNIPTERLSANDLAVHLLLTISNETDEGNPIEADFISWPYPLKFADFSADRGVDISVHKHSSSTSSEINDYDEIHITVQKPTKGLWLDVAKSVSDSGSGGKDGLEVFGDGVRWGENLLDLVSGRKKVVKVWGLRGREVVGQWVDS